MIQAGRQQKDWPARVVLAGLGQAGENEQARLRIVPWYAGVMWNVPGSELTEFQILNLKSQIIIPLPLRRNDSIFQKYQWGNHRHRQSG